MCRFSRSFIAEKNLVNHKKQGISHQITVSFISPNAEPHVHEPRKAGSSHQMISYRDPGPLGIKTVDIQEVGRFLTPSRSHTIVQERSDTFSHSCTFHRHTVLDFFPRWCTSMQQPTTQHNTQDPPQVWPSLRRPRSLACPTCWTSQGSRSAQRGPNPWWAPALCRAARCAPLHGNTTSRKEIQ